MPTLQSKQRYYIGIFTLLLVVLIWVATSFVTNSIFSEQSFERPFFLTYYSTSTFLLYLVPFFVLRLWQASRSWIGLGTKSATGIPTDSSIDSDTTERLLHDQRQQLDDDILRMDDFGIQHGSSDDGQYESLEKLSFQESVKISAYFGFLWFIANYCTNASLAYTTVGSSTILSSMSGLFTLGFGIFFKVEQFNWTKLFAVGISFTGVVLVSWSDRLTTLATHEVHNKLMGDVFALTGAVFYGAYTVLLKRWVGDESRIDMPTFLGFVGLFNICLLWPFFFIMHWSGLESFSLPFHSKLWIMITINAFIGTFLSDYLWLISTLMTSPLVVTLGITLTVPLALIGDLILKHIFPGVQYITGACLVVAGFLIVNISSSEGQKLDRSDNQEDGDETHEMLPQDSL